MLLENAYLLVRILLRIFSFNETSHRVGFKLTFLTPIFILALLFVLFPSCLFLALFEVKMEFLEKRLLIFTIDSFNCIPCINFLVVFQRLITNILSQACLHPRFHFTSYLTFNLPSSPSPLHGCCCHAPLCVSYMSLHRCSDLGKIIPSRHPPCLLYY